jgi:hypothetical protein
MGLTLRLGMVAICVLAGACDGADEASTLEGAPGGDAPGRSGAPGASTGGGGGGGAGASNEPGTSGQPTSPTDPGSGTTPPGDPPDGGGSTPPGVESKGVFVAVGYGSRHIRSTDDGKTWIDDAALISNGGDDNYLLRTVVYGNGEFVGLGYRAMKSADGKTWAPISNPFGQWIGAALWDNSRFVAVGGYGLRATSTNGTTWNDHPIDTVASHAHDSLAVGGGRFVSANDSGKRATSADGVTWTPSTGTQTQTSSVAYGNGVFVSLGGTKVVRSTDGGVTFTDSATLGVTARGLIFAQGHFTALAQGHVYTSNDGVTWTDHPSPAARRGMLAYGHGTYVMLVDGFLLQRSNDGITWDTPVQLKGQGLEAITFGPVP